MSEGGAHVVAALIAMLDDEDREVLQLRRFADLSFDEIGERLGVNAAAARMRFNRAMPRLAKVIQNMQTGRVGDSLLMPRED